MAEFPDCPISPSRPLLERWILGEAVKRRTSFIIFCRVCDNLYPQLCIQEQCFRRRPGLAASITPRSLRRTCLTSGVSVTQVITTSLLFATSLGLSAQTAPSESSCCAFDFVRLWMLTGYPAFSRLWTIALPIIPVPIKPILSLAIFLLILPQVGEG